MLDRATKHAQDIILGIIPAGRSEILACERHMKDQKRQGTADFPYIWDVEKANELIEFAESLTLAEGEDPQPLVLWSFQCFIFGNWNGWVHKDTGARRFRTSYVQVARQNGKSLGNAVPAMYYGNFAGYQYPQIYCTATKEAQAKIVLKECYKFINSDPELCGDEYSDGFFTIKDYSSRILCNNTNGEIKALGRDTKSIDGFRPFFGSVDEYHLHKDNQMFKLLIGGTRKLKQCLISVITTAGFNLNGPCYKLYKYCKQVIYGVVKDETQFVYICELEKEDDYWDESNWRKANPLWTPETLTNLRTDAIKAKAMQGEELRDFLTKALNIWVQFSDGQYMPLDAWAACESDLTLDDFKGAECYAGLDLSSGGDLTTLVIEIPYFTKDAKGNDIKKYHIHSHSFIPAKRVAEHIQTDEAPYDMWIRAGLLTATETLGGIKTDYKYILRYISELIERYGLKIQMIGYDPHNADAFLSDLEALGIDTFLVTQSAKNLNDATDDFRLEVKAGNVTYNKEEALLSWSIANAEITKNSFGEIKIDKERQTDRIDPVDAVIDAHKLAMKAEKPFNSSKYANEEFLNKLWG